MKAADVMTRDVVTVKPDCSVQDAAKTMLEHRISAVPVVGDAGELVGIVSEGDLMRRSEAGTEPRRSWWFELFTPTNVLAAEFVKSHARIVSDVMTRKVLTATPDTPIGSIAALLEKNRIKRVPIVKGGNLVGIVSRANLLQALAAMNKNLGEIGAPEDAGIRDAIIARLRAQPWQPWMLNVTVHHGIVDLWGLVDSPVVKKATRVAAETTPGVHAVNDNLVLCSGPRQV